MSGQESRIVKAYHQKGEFCYKRPDYREARWERAIKVYTINQESKYLLVQGVPAVGAMKELVERFALYGDVEEYRLLDEYPAEEFTEVYWIKYKKIQAARFSKKKLDNHSFFGGLLHVCYAPEYETVDDVREKLNERKKLVARKCKEYFREIRKEGPKEHEEATTSNQKSLHSHIISNLSSAHECVTTELSAPPTLTNVHATSNAVPNVPYPSLPLPAGFPLHTIPPPQLPPPRPEPSLPRVPSKHASLPEEIRNLTAQEVYPDYYGNRVPSEAKNEADSEGSNKPNIIARNNHPNILHEQDVSQPEIKRKRIVWNRPHVSAKDSLPNIEHSAAHSYSQEPGAWDPYKEERKAARAYTSLCPLQIIQQHEQQQQQQQINKRKKQDGRKRI